MLKAKSVLSDCKKAVELMDLENDPQSFRVLWVASLSLLRAVGHVLKKIDAESDSFIQQAVSKHYVYLKSLKSEPHIYWDFIESERNILLKEYELGFLEGSVSVVLQPNMETYEIGDHLYCPMISGPFEGIDCRDLISDAIEWWEAQLEWVVKSSQGLNKPL